MPGDIKCYGLLVCDMDCGPHKVIMSFHGLAAPPARTLWAHAKRIFIMRNIEHTEMRWERFQSTMNMMFHFRRPSIGIVFGAVLNCVEPNWHTIVREPIEKVAGLYWILVWAPLSSLRNAHITFTSLFSFPLRRTYKNWFNAFVIPFVCLLVVIAITIAIDIAFSVFVFCVKSST